MNVNVSDDVAGASSQCLEKLQKVADDPATRSNWKLWLNQCHSHITLLLIRNLFFALRNSLSSSGRSYLKIESAPQTTNVAFSTTFSRLEFANCIVLWLRCWLLPANFTTQEEWHWYWTICSARRRGLRIRGLERAC